MAISYVVTGGGRGIGRAIAERLLADGAHVVVVELDPSAVQWTAPRLSAVIGDARNEAVAARAAAPSKATTPNRPDR